MEVQEALADMQVLVECAERVEALEQAYTKLDRRRQLQAEHASIRTRQDETARARSEATAQLTTATRDEHPRCPTCEQALGAEARAVTVKKLRDRITALGTSYQEDEMALGQVWRAITDLTDELAPWENVDIAGQLAEARQARTQVAALNERAKRLPTIRAELGTAKAARVVEEQEWQQAAEVVARLQEQTNGAPISDVEQSATNVRGTINRLRDQISEYDRQIARCDERLARIADLQAELDRAQAQLAEKREHGQVLMALEKAYGRDGIPALIIENAAIPQIETEANRILTELATEFRVELRTQRALKSREGVREGLDVIVLTPDGERNYATYSGGEKTRIDLALRIALARLLAHRRGAEVRILVLDEPSFLDDEGIELLAQVVRTLGDFDKTLVVSHQPALREAFDQTITVIKDGDRSQLVQGAPVAEKAVA
jgi:exonuclease SbcC